MNAKTMFHMMCQCNYSRNIWTQLCKWLNTATENCLIINNEHILLGYTGKNNNPLNVIIMLTKQFIYKRFIGNTKPNFIHLQKDIKLYYSATTCLAFTECRYDSFYCFWSSFHTILNVT